MGLARKFRSILTMISPKLNTRVTFLFKFKRKLDLKNPRTLNEKLQWLKFNDYWENPTIKQCADKYAVRKYISDVGYEKLLNPLIAAYDDVNDIEWDKLPEKFAIKFNIGCGKNIIVKDKSKLEIESTIKTIKSWFEDDYWRAYSEMQYKDVKPYVLFEHYLESTTGGLPEDYKFYCMNGHCQTIMVCKDRIIGERARYFFMDRDWKLLPYTEEAIASPNESIPKPENMKEAIEIAESLASKFPFVRVDLYLIDNKIYFGELTFTPAGGMDIELMLTPPGETEDVDTIFGQFLTINK